MSGIVGGGALSGILGKSKVAPNINKYNQKANVTSKQVYDVVDYNEGFFDKVYDYAETKLATGCVVVTSVGSGIAKIGEFFDDGFAWIQGKSISGVCRLLGVFGVDGADMVADSIDKSIKDYIARDRVGEAKDYFFKNTTLGQAINEKSDIKYDSETALKIQGVSTKIGEIALATAATVLTGGAAAPVIALGFVEGVGKQAQKTYINTKNTTGAQEAGIFFSGLEGATRWYAYGRIGTGIIDTTKQIGKIASHGGWTTSLGTSNTLKGALKTLFETRRHRDAIKMLTGSAKEALTSFNDIIDISNGIFGTIADSLNNGDMSIFETGGRIVTGLVQNIVINTGVNRVGRIVGTFRTPDFLDSLDNRIISLINTLIKTADAAEDSGVIPLDAYDIGKNILNR